MKIQRKDSQAPSPVQQAPSIQSTRPPAVVQVEPPKPPPEFPDEEVAHTVSPSRATPVYEGVVTTPSVEPSEEDQTPEWAEGFSEQEVNVLKKYNSEDERLKALLNLNRKLTQVSAENAANKKSMQLLLEQQIKHKQVKEESKTIDLATEKEEFKKIFIDDPEKAFDHLMAGAKKVAKAELQETTETLERTQGMEQVKGLFSQYPGMVNEDNAVLIDAMATVAPGETQVERYRAALESYAKDKKWSSTTNAPVEGETVEEMQRQAGKLASRATSNKKKILSSKHLDYLMLHEPEQYMARQEEITQARIEGRVK